MLSQFKCQFKSIQGNRHNLPLARHAATAMNDLGWSNDSMQFQLFHKPWVARLSCGGDSILFIYVFEYF